MRHLLHLWLNILSLCISITDARNFIRTGGSKKLLLYWAVDSDERTIEAVKKNIEHAKTVAGSNCCEVMLAHYREGETKESARKVWGESWYAREVSKSSFGKGFKFHHLKRLYTDDWKSKFDFVWALDSDIDFTALDVSKFIGLARESTSLVVGPTFMGDDVMWHRDDSDSTFLNDMLISFGKTSMVRTHTLLHRIHNLGNQDLRCQMRHTDFVELTAPLLKMDVLRLLLSECSECIQPDSDWGLDMVWCKMATERFGIDQACALLDAAPVTHLDWKTAKVTSDFFKAYHAVQNRFSRYWAQVENKDCLNPHDNSWIDAVGQIMKLEPVWGYR